jgi:DNA-binding transcriptional LysR family regulator
VKTLDLTPGEVIRTLRQGEVDLALTYLSIDLLGRDFYTRKFTSVPSLVVLPGNHRLAGQKQISISQLKLEHFLRVSEECAPGYDFGFRQ